MFRPQGKDDPDPNVGQGADRHTVTFACLALSRVLGFGPGFEPDGLRGKLGQGVAEGFDTRLPLMHLGIVPAFEGNGRRSCEGLDRRGRTVAGAVITPCSPRKRGASRLPAPGSRLNVSRSSCVKKRAVISLS